MSKRETEKQVYGVVSETARNKLHDYCKHHNYVKYGLIGYLIQEYLIQQNMLKSNERFTSIDRITRVPKTLKLNPPSKSNELVNVHITVDRNTVNKLAVKCNNNNADMGKLLLEVLNYCVDSKADKPKDD